MAQLHLDFDNVTFYYPSSTDPVFQELTFRLGPGWTGVIGANGAGKTTLLRLACAQLVPQKGSIRSHERVVYCPQRTDEPPEGLGDLLAGTDAHAYTLRGRLGVQDDWLARWHTLSHGERKRAQIATALRLCPQVFAVDEPTNHIDTTARRALAGALHSFRGVGLLVSHDRELLDTLCTQCLVVDPPLVQIRPGGYTQAARLKRTDEDRARSLAAQVKREVRRLELEAAARAREADRADRKRSKRGLPARSSDAKTKIDLARLTGKDGQAGRLLRQMQGRLRQARDRLRSIRVRRERDLGIPLRGEPVGRRFVLNVTPGSIRVGSGRALVFPELSVERQERVALVGPNGVGKTTFLRHLLDGVDLPEERVVYVPQEIDREQGRAAVGDVRRQPRDRLGEVMSYVACLGSDPQRLLETEEPSPGELRKLMLALGVSRRPHLIAMDEPTNHLDLPSIECLESALGASQCALLLVSHDLRFLRRLAGRWWSFRQDEPHVARLASRATPPVI
jgi:macrolide transport system ATP-binding/permease protein